MTEIVRKSIHSRSNKIVTLLILGVMLALMSVSGVAAEANATQLLSGAPYGGGIAIADNAIAAQSVVSADLDGDGDNDIVSASRGDSTIRWYRNMGGQFPQLTPSTIDYLDGASVVIATDLNRDGAVDIVAAGIGATAEGARLVWYRNNGQPTPMFSRIVLDEGVGLGSPASIESVDLDSDGDIDLLLALRSANRVVWYENSGSVDPGFTHHLITDQADGAAAVKAGDLDLDGDLDVVMAAENTDTIAWFKNEGQSPLRFSPRVIRTATQLPSPDLDFSRTLDLADVNDDGRLDVVYGSEDGGEIGWYENGGGSEPQFLQHVVSVEFGDIKSVFAADADRDGDIDIMAAGGDTVVLFDNRGGSPPEFAQQGLAPAAAGVQTVFAADVNGDGLLDLLSASQDDHRIVWYPNLMVHRSAFYAAQTRSVVATGTKARMVYSGDLDQDGDVDIVSIFEDQILWHQNDGMRPPSFQERIVTSGIDGGRWVNVADLDGDGDLDIISATTADNRIEWHENSGGPTPSFTTRLISKNANGVRAALAADLDGDGDLDVYSASHGDNKIAWYENLDGVAGRFSERVVTTDAAYARSVYAADLDGDGDLDLMSASQRDDKIAWYRNNGEKRPSFTPFTIGYADGVQHVYAADIDGDGDNDILTAAEFEHTITLYENDGAAKPHFLQRVIDQSANAAHAVYADDLDGDGDIDLVAAIEQLNAYKWYENDGQQPAQFVQHLVYNRALAAHGLHVDDIDGDGDNDLLGASRDDGVISWFDNWGGNYAVDLEQTTTAVSAAGRYAELARIVVIHRGRQGDGAIELNSLEFDFWDGSNNRLDDQTFRLLVESAYIYRDSGDGLFNPDEDDQLVWLDQPGLDSEGRLVVPLSINAGVTPIPAGQEQLLFVAMEMTDVCLNPSSAFRLSMVLSSRTARDSRFKVPLSAESVASTTNNSATIGELEKDFLFVNEFMASNNATLPDPQEETEYPDWIEIYNSATFAVNLGGMYLTDDLGEPTKYRIPDQVTVPARGYVIFIADGEETQGPYHTNFRLSSDGESIGLFDTDQAANQIVDIVSFDAQEPDVAFGRFPSGADSWMALGAATPGSPNMNVLLENHVYLPILFARPPSWAGCQ